MIQTIQNNKPVALINHCNYRTDSKGFWAKYGAYVFIFMKKPK